MMFTRKSDFFFLFIAVNLCALLLFFLHAVFMHGNLQTSLREKGEMIERLGLTDLCLFTDARYTRHPSMADLNTPFQDHPTALEHFPSGTLVGPPLHLRTK
jgi:hypothetical protein